MSIPTGTTNVGIGTTVPAAKLDVNSGSLGTTDGDQLEQARFTSNNANASYLRIFTERDGDGSDWETAFTRIQQRTDATDMSYIQFNGAGNTSGTSFGTTGGESMRITSAGNVGIGTAAPNSKLTSQTATTSTSAFTFAGQLNNSSGAMGQPNDGIVALGFHNRADVNATGVGGAIAFSGGGTAAGSGNLIFCIKSTAGIGNVVAPSDEKMRILATGQVLAGATAIPASAGAAKLYSSDSIAAGTGFYCKAGTAATTHGNQFNINFAGSAAALWIDTTNLGNITVSSDYRIKRNISTQTEPALNKIKALRPVTYQMADYGTLFKSNDAIKEGFIAHEVQEIIPSGADGVKDDENTIQSLRVDAILAVVVKAMQEQQVIIESLKTRITALEG